MRGLAALAVLGFHLTFTGVPAALGTAVASTLSLGWAGVQVFFVLSGFVIAHSLRNAEPRAAYLGRFVLRRSIRLDPPYWAAVIATLASVWLSNALFPERRLPLPSGAAVSAHLVYLQDILGYGQILDVLWTLCLEFQMYLVLAALVTGGSWVRRKSGAIARFVGVALAGALLVLSFWVATRPDLHSKTWFIGYWYQFFSGTLAYGWATGRLGPAPVLASVCGCLTVAAAAHPVEPLATLLTTLLLMAAARRGGLSTWLSSAPMRWLGGVSYSLYLTHTLLISRGWNGLQRWGLLEQHHGLVTLGLAGAALLTADLWCRLFERPAQALSRRISLSTPAKR